MKKFLILVLAVVFMLSFAVSGISCKAEVAEALEETVEEAVEEEAVEPVSLIIGVSVPAIGEVPFYLTLVEDGIKKAAEDFGVEVLYLDSGWDTNKQFSDIEDMITAGVDGVVGVAVDVGAIVTAIEALNDAGIPFAAADQKPAGGKVVTLCASENYEGGLIAGEFMAKILDYKGQVGCLEGTAGHEANINRALGFNDAIKQYNPDLETVISQISGKFNNMEEGMTVTENFVEGNPELDGIFGISDPLPLGGIAAIKGTDLDGKVKFVGYDATEDGLKAIQNGDMAGSVAQFPAEMGYISMAALINYIMGWKTEFPEFIASPIIIVDKDNIDTFGSAVDLDKILADNGIVVKKVN